MTEYKERLIDRESCKPGMRGKVNAKCIECIYDEQASGSWRKQAENCTADTCPLYSIRPTSQAGADHD